MKDEMKLGLKHNVIHADFGAIEARVAAALVRPGGKSVLLFDGMEGVPGQTDLHKIRAMELFGVRYDDVTDEQRRYAKEESYLRYYSAGPETMRKMMDRATALRPSFRARLRNRWWRLQERAQKFWDRLLSMLRCEHCRRP